VVGHVYDDVAVDLLDGDLGGGRRGVLGD
jgi:hypothetical protein